MLFIGGFFISQLVALTLAIPLDASFPELLSCGDLVPRTSYGASLSPSTDRVIAIDSGAYVQLHSFHYLEGSLNDYIQIRYRNRGTHLEYIGPSFVSTFYLGLQTNNWVCLVSLTITDRMLTSV